MSNTIAQKADTLFDEFVTAFLATESPVAETFLSLCPEPERQRFQEAVDGFLFAYENYYSCKVNDQIVETAVSRIRHIKHQRQMLAESRARASKESWNKTVTQPLERLASVLYPGLGPIDIQGITIMNRETPRGVDIVGNTLDKFAKHAAERIALREAEILLGRMGVTTVPTPLDLIAEQLGLLVKEAPLEGIEGCLVTNGSTGGILISSLVSDSRRKRYTCAHEIGHFVLHSQSKTQYKNKENEVLNFSDRESELFHPKSRQEFEASAFASYLLLPPQLLPDDFGREVPCFEMADDVSERFDVSLMAVLRRLVKESHHRTVFICNEPERMKMFDFSPEVEANNWIVNQAPDGSVARELAEEGSLETCVREVPANIWFESGTLVDKKATLIEESRRFQTGHIYTLLNVLDEG